MIGFYAAGAGWGRLARIAGIAQHISTPVRVYVLEGSSNCVPLDWHGVDWVAASCGSPRCQGVSPQAFASSIEQDDLEVLVMDTWPYGCMGREMRPVLQDRRHNVLLAGWSPDPSFDAAVFDQVFAYEACGVGEPGPMLAFDSDHIVDRWSVRKQWGVDDDQPVVLLVPSRYGRLNFHEYVRKACAREGIKCIEWEGYPLAPYMAGADLVAGFAGNIVNEARAVGVPHFTVPAPGSPAQRFRATASCGRLDLDVTLAGLKVRDDWAASYDNQAKRVAAAIAGPGNVKDVNIPMPPAIVGSIGALHG